MATMNSGLGGPAGYGENVFSSTPKDAGNNDDGSIYVDATSVFGTDGLDFFGTTYSGFYINSNGNISFGSPNTDYQITDLALVNEPTIAPFFGDVNINRNGEIYWDLDPANGTITITWDGVAPYYGQGTNSFQLVLTSTGDGNFDIEFIYEDITWTTGYGDPALAGITDGAGTVTELNGSGDTTVMETWETYDFGDGDPAGTVDFSFVDGAVAVPDGIVEGTDGNDIIDGTYTGDPTGDLIDNGDGSGPSGNIDTIFAFDGDDTVYAGDGDDIIYGGAGADNIFAEDGNDTIYGDDGVGATATSEDLNWSLEGTDGANLSNGFTQNTGTMDVSVSFTDDGNNGASLTLSTTDVNYADTGETFDPNSSGYVSGNGDADTGTVTIDFAAADGSGMTDAVENVTFRLNDIDAGAHTDVLTVNAFDADGNPVTVTLTAAGNDTVTGQTVTAGASLDTPDSAAGSVLVTIAGPVSRIDIIYTNDASGFHGINITDVEFDTIPAVPGNDTIDGGAGDDVIYGEGGDDTITGGAGADTLSGGTGDDTLYVGAGDTATGGDGDDTFILDAANAFGGAGSTISIVGDEADETLGDTLDFQGLIDWGSITFSDPESGTVLLSDGTSVAFSNIENIIICFTHGTMIDTPAGPCPIEQLRRGDMVLTRDNGPQRVRWMGKRTVRGQGMFAPVRFDVGAFGNDRPLFVSPQHRMLYTGSRANLYFESSEVIVPAKHLVNNGLIQQVEVPWVTYYHMLFDQHEVVWGNGIPSESFHPGGLGLEALAPQSREELFALFPELRSNPNGYGRTARKVLRQFEARLIAA